MPDQILIGGSPKGLNTALLPFAIDNDSFPTLYNFYAWRGRYAKKKRGTISLGRLERQMQMAVSPNNWQVGQMALVVGAGNFISNYSLGNGSSIVPGSISVTVGSNTYTEPATPNGTLIGSPSGTGTINYATGAVTILGGGLGPMTGNFSYYPGLVSLGARDFVSSLSSARFPLLLAFDEDYSYQFNQTTNRFYNVNYYKGSNNPFVWSGTDFQQFWTTNYSSTFTLTSGNYVSTLWATNNKPGFNFQNISTITVGNPTIITTSSPHGLVTGDYVFFNEITGTDSAMLNGKAFTITRTGATTFTVAVNTTGLVINNNGIFQTLTATSIAGQDGIKWYDGDPTGGTGLPTGTGLGWVNFNPPLTATVTQIEGLPPALYYLVGAQAILPFKDRLLFFSPWVQTSTGNAIQLQDTVLWSWNGTPFYNALVPTGESFDITAYYVDVTGKGGYQSAGIQQTITAISNNEDVLLVLFSRKHTRFVYTGNDIQPFAFYSINSELGATSIFSGVTLDKGALSIGTYGLTLTEQTQAERVDLQIPNTIFQIRNLNNGALRVNSVRDYFNEWIYFTYPLNTSQWNFPVQTLMFNYRENSWAIFYENFTTQGYFRRQNKYTWATLPFKTWSQWREAWNSGSTSAQFPNTVGGTPQGYFLIKGQGTGESPSGSIKAIAASNSNCLITSINHCVKQGDYLYIQGCLGTNSINTQIGMVTSTPSADTFVIDLLFPAGTYLGLGTFTRLIQPLAQTKQFNPYWGQGRKMRLGVQKYLLDYTAGSQITLNINLSQDPDDIWNTGPIVPMVNSTNNSLIYSQVLYTCPELENLGLSPANINLQMPTAQGQYQIWHRENTSLIGDSVQIGLTLSDEQMRNLQYATDEITLHAIHLDIFPGPYLA